MLFLAFGRFLRGLVARALLGDLLESLSDGVADLGDFGLAYLDSGIVRTIPPITSLGLKSLFGLSGCAL